MGTLVTWITVLAAVFGLVASENSYVVMLPKSIRPGLNMEVYVNILRGDGPVLVKASLLDAKNATIVESTNTFSQGSVYPSTISLQIPADLGYGEYTIHVEGTGGLTFENITDVTYESKSSSIFIQTDKAIYKPGQTIHFRALGTHPNLQIVKGTMDIDIYDPKGNKIQQWLNVEGGEDSKGIFEGEMIMSDQPVLGDWKIKVTLNNVAEEHIFEVAEYVLPKFEVTVTLPPYGITTDKSFGGKVHAKYTYGKDVKGTLNLRVKRKPHRWSWNADTWPTLETKMPINGEVKFSFTMAEMNTLTPHMSYEWFLVEANVTEDLTGITLNGSSEVQLFDDATKMEFPQSLPRDFKPGLKYKAYLKVSQQDDRPFVNPNGQVMVEISFFTEIPPEKTTSTTPITTSAIAEQLIGGLGAEIAPVKEKLVPVVEPPIDRIFLPPPFPREKETKLPQQPFDIPKDGIIPITIDVPLDTIRVSVQAEYGKIRAYLSLSKSYSPSKSYMQVRLLNDKPKSGESATVEIKTTDPNVDVAYQVISKGAIVDTGSYSVGNTKVANMSLYITTAMAPKAKLVAHYIRPDGEIVADAVTFNTEGMFKNKVSIDFSTWRALPGDQVSVEVKADAYSLVNLLCVDKSVLLLKSGNDITPDQVEKEMQSYDKTGGGSRPDIWFRWPVPSGGRDATGVFKNSGMIVMTDAVLYSHYRENQWLQPMAFAEGAGGAEALRGQVFFNMNVDAAVIPMVPSQDKLKNPRRIRNFFPETWLWTSVTARSDGTATITTTVPDTITSWVASAFAINPDSGLGVAPTTASLKAFMPFFVSLTLPYSMVRKEQAVIQANVFNHMARHIYALVTLSRSKDFDNVIIFRNGRTTIFSARVSRYVFVRRGEAVSVSFPIVPRTLGDVEISVSARSILAADAVQRKILVEAEGIEKEYSSPVLVELKDGAPFQEILPITFPADVVPGSERIRVTAIGDMMGSSINGLDKLLKMPYGCGEQNMLNFAPNIYVTQYLEITNHLTPDIKDKAKRFMLKGYQRELTYQHTDGSFSAFGDSDPSGSTWLTAFVLKSFSQARTHIYIDIQKLAEAASWLVNNQIKDGTFKEPGKVLHKEMQGGSAKESLTAYVLIALLEAKDVPEMPPGVAGAILRAKVLLEGQVTSMTNPYELAIAAYALALANSTASNDALTKLEGLAVIEGGAKHWTKPQVAPSDPNRRVKRWAPPHEKSNALDIEMTAYVLLTYALKSDTENGLMVVKWLTKQRNPDGGFQSTQDTVIALQALAEIAAKIYSPEFDQTIDVSDANSGIAGFAHQFVVNKQNSLVLQSVDVPETTRGIRISATGRGMSLVELAVSYNVEAEIEEPSFDVNVTTSDESLNSFTLTVCTRWLLPDTSGMAVLEVGTPSGFEADKFSVTEFKALKRTETGYRKMILYFDEIGQEAVCVTMRMQRTDQVAAIQPATIRMYDYYSPTNQKTLFYIPDILKTSTICDVCGTECGCPAQP